MVVNEFSFVDLFRIANVMAHGAVGDAADAVEKYGRYAAKAGDPDYHGGYSVSSTAKAASRLIAIFPILCSSNVKKETASTITKYIERRGCVQLQLTLTAINLNNAESGFEYLRNFHQNIAGGGSLSDYEMMLQRMYDVNNGASASNESFNLSTMEMKTFVETLKEAYASREYEDNYNRLSLNDYVVTESEYGYAVSIDPFKDIHAYNEAGSGKGPEKVSLKDSDVKKANEAVPSLMIVRFTNKETKTTTEFIIGVKAKLIPADWMEIITKIYNKNKDGRGLVNLIRATTGEINIITDYLLAMDRQKEDVLARKKKGSLEPIWKTLENRAAKAELALRQGKTNYAAAITTVVITSEDADYLYKNENINIRNIKEAKKFMQAYNLMGFIITNDAEEVAWLIFDEEDPYFEKLSYTMLERETSDGQYKKIVNLISKMR